MDNKAAFEKWLKEERPTTYRYVFEVQEEDDEEMTNHFKASVLYMRTGWDGAWQASRAAIEIPSSSDSEYWFEGEFQRMRYERDVEKAITSQGLTIKK